MKLDLAKEFYLDEWTRRDQLSAGIGTPITVLTAIGGTVVLMIQSFSNGHFRLTTVFAGAACSAVASLLVATYCIARSYHGYEYQRVPRAAEIDAYSKELRDYHAQVAGSTEAANVDCENYLAERFVEAADCNAGNNDSKSAYLYRSSQAILLALVFAAIAGVPWAWSAAREESEPQTVRIEPVTVVPQRGYIRVEIDSATHGPTAGAKAPVPSDSTQAHRPSKPVD